MFVELGFLGEAFTAVRALEEKAPVVALQVDLQCTVLGSSVLAVVTLVWLLTYNAERI